MSYSVACFRPALVSRYSLDTPECLGLLQDADIGHFKAVAFRWLAGKVPPVLGPTFVTAILAMQFI